MYLFGRGLSQEFIVNVSLLVLRDPLDTLGLLQFLDLERGGREGGRKGGREGGRERGREEGGRREGEDLLIYWLNAEVVTEHEVLGRLPH